MKQSYKALELICVAGWKTLQSTFSTVVGHVLATFELRVLRPTSFNLLSILTIGS
jgi:hypothetical protein